MTPVGPVCACHGDTVEPPSLFSLRVTSVAVPATRQAGEGRDRVLHPPVPWVAAVVPKDWLTETSVHSRVAPAWAVPCAQRWGIRGAMCPAWLLENQVICVITVITAVKVRITVAGAQRRPG